MTRAEWVGGVGLGGAVFTAALGALGLAGWLGPWPSLAAGTAFEFRMAPSTAALFAALGAGLAAHARGRLQRLAPWLGALVAALAVLSLWSHAVGEIAWFDRLLLPGLGSSPTRLEGRMAPLTAIGFLCAGVATIGLALERRWHRAGDVAGGLGAFVLALGLLVGLTYAYGTHSRQSSLVPVAATTALAFVGLGTALVALHGPVRFPLRLLSGPSHAARLARAILPVVPLVVLSQAACFALAAVFEDAVRDALLSLVVLAAVLFGVFAAARGAGRYLDQAEVERRRAEASEARLEALFRGSPLAIVISEFAGGRLLDVNERCATFFGYRVDEMVGRTSEELGLWPDPAIRAQVVARLRAGEPIEGVEVRFRRRGGGTRDGLVSTSVVAIAGQPPLAVTVIADVTLRKQLESRFLQAQSLEAVGRLAGGIAHDFNNLLGVILGHADRLQEDASPAVARRAAEIARAGTRAATLTRQLLAFSRKQVIEPVVLDLNVLVADLAGLVRGMLGEGVELVLRPGPEPALVLADPGQLQQVVINLCANAGDAMPQGGTLRIETGVARSGGTEPPAAAGAGRDAGQYVRLVVADTGVGMDAVTLAHVFEPFFSATRDLSQPHGTGLGLPTVYGIVKQSGGRIDVFSEPGRGSRFEILLPRSGAALEPTGDRAAVRPERAMATVLLAEDEPALRELTAEVLEEAGYRVLAAEDAEQALALAADHAGRIDLLVTDVVMPGADGRQLATRLRAERPEVRVLFVSGYPEEIITQEGRVEPGISLLAKPFTSADLLRRVAEALDGPAVAGALLAPEPSARGSQ